MQTNSLSYAEYWRNSLADADAGNGTFQVAPEFQNLSREELSTGLIGQAIIAAYFAKEDEKTRFVEVVIRPKVYVSRLEHRIQRRTGTPAIVTPIVASANLARDGRLYPLSRVVVPRDILEPLERGNFSIGLVSDQDAFLTTNTIPGIDAATDDGAHLSNDEFSRQWASFLAFGDQLLEQIGKGWPGDEDGYILAEHGYLVKKESFSASQGIKQIIALYDDIRSKSPAVPLFEHYASTNILPPEPCLPPHAAFSRRLAHASNLFPLAPAQRHALAHLMAAKAGEILAINGPPGTGKTTLLLSVVASLWAEAAIANGEPPVVLAASTNNQAVTNILDAFGKDFATGDGPFAGRWLPCVSSFGAYFPAQKKEVEASKKFQTHGFFKTVESDAYVTMAQKAYLSAAAAAFPDIAKESLNVSITVNTLRTAIQAEAKKLTDIESAWSDLSVARTTVRTELGEAPAVRVTQRRQQLESTTVEKNTIDRLVEQWEHYLAHEPLFYAILSWLPPVAKRRIRLARLFLKPIWSAWHAQGTWETIDKIETSIKAIAEQLDQTVREQGYIVKRGEAVLKAERACLAKWQAALVHLGKSDQADNFCIADCDPVADTCIRFKIFLLTTHYWEGRWLLEMQDLLPHIEEERKKTGRVALEIRWRRRMKLTPCIVSTFFMLPKEMRVRQHDGRGFVPDYLYDFADLLIVDEAGQVLPEVAGASFALSKKALVIGDTMQIEPIWSVPRSVDIGNMLSAKLLASEDHEDAYGHLSEIGKTAAFGSVMRISQTLTRYHYDPDLARGMFLKEHYRCFDEIIGYCNALCYKGKLVPKRGKKIDAENPCDGLPALGYLHTDGICQKSSGGSRLNMHEAEIIAAWLLSNHDSLEASYGQPLHKIVGVVTPFAGQVQAISTACRNVGIRVGNDKDEMTVGTVHALQGAERPVVIFSPTYTKHADGSFIDDSRSMLNVAVSRAKNTFLVFGDMDVFESIPKKRPRDMLATFLFRDPRNALHFEQQTRQDLQATGADVRPLRDAQEHDTFLLEAIARATREIQIVSPWIILERIEEIGALGAMRSAVQRGVKVTIYTDPELNTGNSPEKREVLLSAARILRDAKVHVDFVARVHSKALIGDDDLYCVGSFNWLSASRDNQYARHETSLA
ncbi:MAG: AAA domain-containing protein, partial [Burkholderiaceae bacterium]